MRYLLAILCGLAVVVAQLLYGGAMRPVFALPAYGLVGVAGLLGLWGLTWRNAVLPNWSCVGTVVLFAGWLLWREVAAEDPWLAAGYLRLTLACLSLYLIFALVLTHPYPRLAFCVVLLIFALGQAALAAWQFTHVHHEFPLPWMSRQLEIWYSGRFSHVAHGFYLNRNHLAWFLNAAGLMGLALCCWGRWGIKVKVLVFYVTLMSLGAAVMTGSRGGMLGLAAGLTVFFMGSGAVLVVGAKGRRVVALLVMAGALLCAGGGVTLVFQNSFFVQDRFQILFDDNYRHQVFDAGFRQFQLAPLLGTGPGTFSYFARQFRETQALFDDLYAHNDWLQLAGDFGFPALALLLVLVILHATHGTRGMLAVLRSRMRSSARPQSHSVALVLGALSCLAAFGIHSIFDFNMQVPANALLAAALLGFLSSPGVDAGGARHHGLRRLLKRIPGYLVLATAAGALLITVWEAGRPEYHLLEAENANLKGDWQSGLLETERGLAAKPDNPGLHETRAQALLLRSLSRRDFVDRWRDSYKATQELELAVAAVPGDWTTRLLYLEALVSTGQLAKAEDELFVVAPLNLDHGRVYELYSQILENQGKFAEALRFQTYAQRRPGSTWDRLRHKELVRKAKETAAGAKKGDGEVFR